MGNAPSNKEMAKPTKKQVETTGYVMVSRPSENDKREQLSEWEDIDVDASGDAVLRSVKSDAPNGQQFLRGAIEIPRERVGEAFFVVKPKGKSTNSK